jgi:long-chain acyl-CoA synthetase
MKAITDLFEECTLKYPDNVCLWEKKTGNYEALTYKQLKEQVYKFSAGLISAGLNKGDRVTLLAEGRNEWIIGELGLLYAGAVSVPLSVKLNGADEIFFRLQHSGSRMIIASSNQAKKIQPIKNKLAGLEKIILTDPPENYNEKGIFFYDIIKSGEIFLKDNKEVFEQRWKSVKPEDYATICYTSGTTADPKGIILTHRNYTANAEQSLSLIDVPEYFVNLLILPWDHSFAHTGGIYTVMKSGASIASVQLGKTAMETLKNIPLCIKETKPHFILSVPSLAKNFRKNIESGISKKGKLINGLFNFGLKIAYTYNGTGWNRGGGFKFILKPIYSIIDKIIFKKIRENFGGRLKFFVGGGALLDIELQRFFYALGMPMFQGYGLTEAAPVISANSLKKHKLGSSGFPAKNLEIKICDDKGKKLATGEKGEIVIRGENVMAGYWKNEEATAQTIIDGWLHTGDMGYLDSDGFLYVLGRFKSLLIGDDGEKYSPESIEEALVGHSHFIEQCMLYNNQCPYTVAFVVPNKEALKKWLHEKHHHEGLDDIDAALKLIETEVNGYRSGKKYGNIFPQRWLPVSVAILDDPFTEENNLINSTMKLVRGKVTERYSERINYLYSTEAKNICNGYNRAAMKRLLK